MGNEGRVWQWIVDTMDRWMTSVMYRSICHLKPLVWDKGDRE